MDSRLLRPKELTCDPNSPDAPKIFKFWLRTVEDFIATLEENAPNESTINKVRILINCLSPDIYPLIEEEKTYDDIIATLQRTYVKKKNNVFARYSLLTRQQSSEESISTYMQALKSLAKDCNFSDVSAECYRDELIRDSFINGLNSPIIRQRLLEIGDLELITAQEIAENLDTAYKQSLAMGNRQTSQPLVAAQETNKHNLEQETAAVTYGSNRENFGKKSCFFCGSTTLHNRARCPARNAECKFCHKIGHFMEVCLSLPSKRQKSKPFSASSAFVTSGNAILSSTVAAAPSSLSMAVAPATINGSVINVLFDSGASENFIDYKIVKNLQLHIHRTSLSEISMASTSLSMKSLGSVKLSVDVLDRHYDGICFEIIDNLCADAILGQNFFKLHKEIIFEPGGKNQSLTINKNREKKLCVSAANIESPYLFEFTSQNIKPIAIRSRSYTKEDSDFINEEIQKLLNADIIESSRSPWRAQVLVVQRENKKKRMVVDYSQTINKFTELDAYPLPKMESIINNISQDKYYSSIDLRSAYYQVPLKEEERHYTAFEAGGKLYQYKRLPFGVTNGVSVFQRIIDEFISRNNLKKTYAYLDDLTVTGSTLQEHDENLKALLDAAKRYNLTINEDKSKFRMTKINMLGYEIEYGTVKPDAQRLQPLIDLTPPKTMQELKRINGMFAYYAKWIPNFSRKAEHLIKAKCIPLSTDALDAFQNLKSELMKASLGSIKDDIPFEVECDASDHTIAAILSQSGRPVAYMSRTLNKNEQNFPAVEKEATAIIEAVRKWTHFLKGRFFHLITDQRSVSYMFDQANRGKIKNSKILMWRIELSQFKYDIRHKPGIQNVAPDAFSRVCFSITSESDTKKLESLHHSLGHPGFARLYNFVRSRNLPFTSEETKEICRSCRTCAELKPRFFKTEPTKLVKATRSWERLSIDFKGPVKGQYPYLLVVIDEYSRYPFVFPCKHMTASTVINCLSTIFTLFGYPEYVHSDRGSSFISHELKEFLLMRKIATSRSTPYHPQGNSQCERANQTIWRTIKLLLHGNNLPEERWTEVLPNALHAIRSLICLSTNQTPHERMFTFQRRAVNGTSLPSWLSSRQPVLLRRFVRTKGEPLCDQVELVDANPSYACIRYNDGRESTVSTSDLAPLPTPSLPSFSPSDLQNLSMGENNYIQQNNEASVGDNDYTTTDEKTIPRRSERISRPPERYGFNVHDM